MPDDKSKVGYSDGDRINVNEPDEVRYWAKKLMISEEHLRDVIKRVGPIVKDVWQHLNL